MPTNTSLFTKKYTHTSSRETAATKNTNPTDLPASADTPKPPTSALEDKLAVLTISQLRALQANAQRISTETKHSKKAEAETLIPLIADELAVREEQEIAAKAERRKEMAQKRAEAKRSK